MAGRRKMDIGMQRQSLLKGDEVTAMTTNPELGRASIQTLFISWF